MKVRYERVKFMGRDAVKVQICAGCDEWLLMMNPDAPIKKEEFDAIVIDAVADHMLQEIHLEDGED